jgi:tetratricopeptide (TPR) repeat protein
VREYFGERLKEKSPEAWKEAHGRLYEYYRDLPEKELPDTIEEMAPLFLSVIHGCKAGRFKEASEEVYWKRILRGNEFYSTNILGAFGADLAAISGFFDPPWKNPVKELKENARAFLLNEAALCLRALGRLGEAKEPMKAGLDFRISLKDWKNAARSASNLSELYLTLGNIGEAIRYGEKSVHYADKSGLKSQKMINRTTLADALFQSGDMKKAEELFLEAEAIQKEWQPEYPFLYSLYGFRFCELKLSRGDYKEARKRGEKTLEWLSKAGIDILSIPLDHLTIGRAYLQSGDMKEAGEYLNLAVDGLRKAGDKEFVARGLLSRSGFFRIKGDFAKAMRDLEEAWEIATRSGMKLFICDIHIESCRFLLSIIEKNNLEILKDIAPESPFAAFNDSTDPLKAAKSHIEEASKIIEETCYHRRDVEILLETAHLQIIEGKKVEAEKILQSAKKTIDESGLHSWDVEYQKLSEKLR